MKIIRLWSKGRNWLAEYDGEGAEGIKLLMGSTLIPTAYTILKPKEEVIAELERLNPGYTIL